MDCRICLFVYIKMCMEMSVDGFFFRPSCRRIFGSFVYPLIQGFRIGLVASMRIEGPRCYRAQRAEGLLDRGISGHVPAFFNDHIVRGSLNFCRLHEPRVLPPYLRVKLAKGWSGWRWPKETSVIGLWLGGWAKLLMCRSLSRLKVFQAKGQSKWGLTRLRIF